MSDFFDNAKRQKFGIPSVQVQAPAPAPAPAPAATKPDPGMPGSEVKAHIRLIAPPLNAIDPFLRRGDVAGAEARCKEAEAFLADYANKGSAPDIICAMGLGYSTLGSAYRLMQNVPQAELFYGKAMELFATIASLDKHAQFVGNQLAACHNQLGLLYMQCGPQDKAIASLEEAIAMRRKLVAAYPGDYANLVYLGGAVCNRGHIAANKAETEAARQLYDEAIAIFDRVDPKHDPACQEVHEAMLSALSAAGRVPQWLMMAQQFRENAENGRRGLPA